MSIGKPKFDSAEVKAFFKQTAQLGGDSKKIDTNLEREKLAEYLSGNADNLSENDFAILDSFVQSSPKNNAKPAPTNNIELDLDIEEGSLSQINIGDDNKNTVIVKNLVEVPPEKHVDKPVNKKEGTPATGEVGTPDKKTDKPANKKEGTSATGEVGAPGKKKDEPPKQIDGPREFKYNIWVNMMPGPGRAKDLSYIKENACAKIQQLPFTKEEIKDLINGIMNAKSRDEIINFLASRGIGITFPS